MRMKHTVKLKSGCQKVYEFRTTADSNKALKNAIILHNAFNTIKCIWIEPINYPENRKRIDF